MDGCLQEAKKGPIQLVTYLQKCYLRHSRGKNIFIVWTVY